MPVTHRRYLEELESTRHQFQQLSEKLEETSERLGWALDELKERKRQLEQISRAYQASSQMMKTSVTSTITINTMITEIKAVLEQRRLELDGAETKFRRAAVRHAVVAAVTGSVWTMFCFVLWDEICGWVAD